MKIKILPSASQDLIDGYWFYEKQSPGLGNSLNATNVYRLVSPCLTQPYGIGRKVMQYRRSKTPGGNLLFYGCDLSEKQDSVL